MKNLENWNQFNESKVNENNPGLLLRNNKRFWIGSVNASDGYIEEVHTYEEASSYDFHHSFYFSNRQLEKIDNEECFIFWINDDNIVSQWKHGKTPPHIIGNIKKQIKTNRNKMKYIKNHEHFTGVRNWKTYRENEWNYEIIKELYEDMFGLDLDKHIYLGDIKDLIMKYATTHQQGIESIIAKILIDNNHIIINDYCDDISDIWKK